MEKADFYQFTRNDLEDYISIHAASVSRQHAKSLFQQAYKKLERKPWSSSTLPQKLMQNFEEGFSTSPLSIANEEVSEIDASVKFGLRTLDGSVIEAVLIPEKARITVCVSSQVGCAQNCAFCYTGRMGLKRNLSAGEIVAQVVAMNEWIARHPDWLATRYPQLRRKVSNIVFMGMGEPLDNVQNLIQAIRILVDPLGLAIGLKKISVSTAGHLDGLAKLLLAFPKIPIALSLHASTDALRRKLMPINEKWNIASLLQMLRQINATQKQEVLIQYTLIKNVNDRREDAEALAKLLEGYLVKINLIPFNELSVSVFQRPDEESIFRFKDYLHHQGFRTLVRFSKGRDIQGACGQLFKKAVDA